MAAYAAIHPFKLSLEDFLSSSQASFVPATQLQLLRSAHHAFESLYKDVTFKEMFFKNTRRWRDREKALVEGIRDAVRRVEDMLDDLLSTHHSLAIPRPLEFTLHFRSEINSFIQLVANAKKEFAQIWEEQKHSKPEEEGGEEEDSDDEGEIDGEGEEEERGVGYEEDELQSTHNYAMVGLVDQFIQLRRRLLLPTHRLDLVSIVGMVGIGKTAMARQLYNDPFISKRYCQHCAFVSVGKSPHLKQVVIDILSQIQNHFDIVNMQRMSTSELVDCLEKCMAHCRYLIVLDDVWNDIAIKLLRRLYGRSLKVCILVTTRIHTVSDYHIDKYNVELRLLNDDESWRLFCEKVFGKYACCPYKLVEAGKKIVENCEGLPLAIIAIADRLAQGDMSIDCWKKVSEDPNPLSIGTNDQHPALNTLYSSYEELEQGEQAFFLYMGIFPRKQEISLTKLRRLYQAERFVPPYPHLHPYEVIHVFRSLSSQSVIFITRSTLSQGFKTCRLHSVFWNLCLSEARKEYIFQLVNKFSRNSFREDLNSHRRICVHNNTLFGIKEANNVMLSMPNARSLLCTGPHHHYPVPMEFKMRLLRVLDVVTIRFYVFPSEVVQLLLLRYLAFTYNGMLHASISQLWNLEFLIVEQQTSIISPEAPLRMPVEIWNMKKLRHLQVTGALLPHPPKGAILPNLFSISKINAQCLTSVVFRSIPKLRKLSIQIDLSAHDPFCFYDHLCRVDALVSLKCVVLNPKPRSQSVDPPAPLKIFPLELRKLTLSGFGYPWKYFEELCNLYSLEVLKLRNYAFQGSEWETCSDVSWLKVLHLEDLDLISWRVARWQFPALRKLTVRHCYKLRAIPLEVGVREDSRLDLLVEVVEVQPSVVASANNIGQRLRNDGVGVELNINCSYGDRH